MDNLTQTEQAAIAYLRSPAAIRERCQQVLALACADQLAHFRYDPEQLPAVAAYIAAVTRQAYPDLRIPFHSRWRHFGAGGYDRVAQLDRHLSTLSPTERGRCHFELAITSVLLDAGAGGQWHYYEAETAQTFSRSEGLAVASFHMFVDGGFSSRAEPLWQADAAGLQQMTETRLAQAMQVTPDNCLVGLHGRMHLLRRLGNVVASMPQYFGTSEPRLGNLFDALCALAPDGVLAAPRLLCSVLESFAPIWPGGSTLAGVPLGDVWFHRQVQGEGVSAGLVPFHKLSQWLTYSLIEPLQEAGITVTDIDLLTGLPEYRNGGLLLDLRALVPKQAELLAQTHAVGSAVVVEWRALTVALLDHVAHHVRHLLKMSVEEYPLARILEGGTWRAGRQIARERRADGSPPLRVESDGTVF